MKLLTVLFATFFLSTAIAQNSEMVTYKVETPEAITSLRISARNSRNEEVDANATIESIGSSEIYLCVDPSLNYDLLVNNSINLVVSSEEIVASMHQKSEETQENFMLNTNWLTANSDAIMAQNSDDE